jgi:hypothetical protein
VIAPGILGGLANAFSGKGDGPGDAVDGQVAGDGIVGAAFRVNIGRFEGDGRVFLSVEELSALDVAIALGVACVQRGDGDRSLNFRMGVVGFVELERAGKASEVALHI